MLRDGFKYSEKELAMAAHFGVADIAETMSATVFYRVMVERAFVANDQSKWAESLRRCFRALDATDRKVWRCTPEWDAMIEGE